MPSIVNSNPLTLSNIGRGDTIERFDEMLRKCLLNIKEPNTSLKPRKIIIEVTVTPGVDRDTADFNVDVKPKFQPTLPYRSSIIIGPNLEGNLEAHEAIEVSDESENLDDSIDDEELDEI